MRCIRPQYSTKRYATAGTAHKRDELAPVPTSTHPIQHQKETRK